MENKNQPAFATSTPSCKQYDGYIQEGLTKLEYFSIHCLHGMLSNSSYINDTEKLSKRSIEYAKELLKQLEDESNK